LGEKESLPIKKKLADARAKRWNPEMEELYARTEKKLDKLWKEDKFDEYLETVNSSTNELEILKSKGGDRGDILNKIREKKLFYDKNKNLAESDYLARKWNPEMEELYAKIEKKSEELWKDGEYPDYIDYLRDKVNKLNDLKDKGGTKSELVTSIRNKINKYGERLKAEQKLISERISLFGDAARVDESFNKKIERERDKEILREAQLRSYLNSRRFDPPFIHFPGSPQAEMHRYKYGTNGFKSSVYAYASFASFLGVGVGMVQYQMNVGSYIGETNTPPYAYLNLFQNGNTELGLWLAYSERERFSKSYDRALDSASMINEGIGFFGFLILLSNFDLSLSSKINDLSAKRNGIPLYNFEKGSLGINAKMSPFSPVQKYLGSEMQYNLEYNYQF
jgi:hypothetical protein